MLISSCAVVKRTVTWWGGNLKALVVKQKSFELEREKNVFKPTGKGDKWTIFALKGNIEQRIRISARKRSRGPGLWKQLCPALTASVESCDKHLKTPQKR